MPRSADKHLIDVDETLCEIVNNSFAPESYELTSADFISLLIDIRHAPSENDRIMYDWIRRNGYDPIIIATKLDKINRSQIQKQVKLIRTTLQAGADTQIVPYSAQTKQGREEIYEILDGVLAAEDPAQE